MATITRNNLLDALENASNEFVSREAKHRLLGWAHDAKTFTVGDWENCPLDQVGLVDKFTSRSKYDEAENYRFICEASELDARLLAHIKTPLAGELEGGLEVRVVS